MNEIIPSLSNSKNKKRLFLGLFATILLLLTAIVSIAAGVKKSSPNATNKDHQLTHTILKSSCSSTLHPDLCFSSISSLPRAKTIKTTKDVIALSLNVTISSVQKTYSKIEKIASSGKGSFSVREKAAIGDCLELLSETLDEINEVVEDLHHYPSSNKSIAQHAQDLNILLSAAMTNQDTCLDGFSHDQHDHKVRDLFIGEETNVLRHCSNNLAMIKNMTDTDMARSTISSSERKLEEENGIKWPEWLSAADRRLLEATTIFPNVVVAADGSGDFLTVSEAVAAAPNRSISRYTIRIKPGVYRENVEVPPSKTKIMFAGDDSMTTIITANRNVIDGSTAYKSATVAVVGRGFLARDITFENTAGPSKHQAVALRVGSDLSAFYRCNIIAFQDTLYVHKLRQFYVGCFIIGSVDFIFGNAAAILQYCDILARRPDPGQKNMVTAQGRTLPIQNTGIVIQKCKIGATKDLQDAIASFPTYLGRPWKQYSRTVIMQTDISNIIHPAGWFEWNGSFALDTLVYREYQNTGLGANTTNRVAWKGFRVITERIEAIQYTVEFFILGIFWLPFTGFPFSIGL